MNNVRHSLAGMITALDIHYNHGPGHPLVGRRMPDLRLKTGDGDTRVLEVLRGGRPVLLDFGAGIADVRGVNVAGVDGAEALGVNGAEALGVNAAGIDVPGVDGARDGAAGVGWAGLAT